jgi:beta-lactamase regulating signal transducer with metallopeptidase domain
MTVPDLQSVAQLFTGRLLNTAAEGVVLAGMVWVLLRLIGRQNSGTRFAVWFSALLAIVALPFLSGSGFGASHSRALPPANLHVGITLSSSWASYLFAAWGVVAGLLLLRLSVGLWRVRQIRRKCSPAELAGLDPAMAGILRDFGSRRRVKVCVSSEVAVPAAIGFFRPAIVFPAWLLPRLSPEDMRVILLHELAHVQRWDDWTNLAQKIVKALFFFHPAVWWIESRLTLEREMACDDIVLATASPRAYASSLISFAEKLQNARALTLLQTLGSRMRDMSLRVAQILDTKRPSRTGLGKPVLGLSAGLLVLVFGAAHYAPRLVAFETQPQHRQTQTMHAIQQATDAELQPEAAGATSSRTAAALDSERSSLAPQHGVIPPVFNPLTAVVTPHLRATSPRKPGVMRLRATPEHLPLQETFVILRTTQYDASGAGVWTLCIWRVGGENSAERHLQSAIVLSSI